MKRVSLVVEFARALETRRRMVENTRTTIIRDEQNHQWLWFGCCRCCGNFSHFIHGLELGLDLYVNRSLLLVLCFFFSLSFVLLCWAILLVNERERKNLRFSFYGEVLLDGFLIHFK